MTLLTATQDAMVLCGLPQPVQAIGNSDATVAQFVAFAQKEADETFTDFNWRSTKVNAQIIGDNATTLFSLPADFERIVAGQALWSTKYPSIPLQGPISDVELIALKALPVMPVRPVWRLIGTTLEIWPALSTGETVNLEYFTSYPIYAADGVTRKARFTADTDYAVFPETILTRGLIWRFKQSKGLDYAEDFRTYDRERDKRASHEAGGRVVQMTNTYNLGSNQWPGLITIISP